MAIDFDGEECQRQRPWEQAEGEGRGDGADERPDEQTDSQKMM